MNRGAVEQSQCLDIRQLRKRGLVRLGYSATTSWYWRRGDDDAGSVGLTISIPSLEDGRAELSYAHRGVPALQTVRLEARPCRYGGHRFYFLCPATGERVEVLAFAGGRFVSRKAARLTHASQGETKFDRLIRARGKLEDRTFGGNGHPRPRGRNRERLAERWYALDSAIDEEMERQFFSRFGRYL